MTGHWEHWSRPFIRAIEDFHGRHVYDRRLRILSERLAGVMPQGATILDVGCGDGLLAARVLGQRPDLAIRGVDILARGETQIPVDTYQPPELPYPERSFDVVTLVDVLHHSDDPIGLLRQATCIGRQLVVVKDHLLQGLLAGSALRFMDYFGNARYGVPLPYNFWTRRQWRTAFGSLGLPVVSWEEHLGLYLWPASLLFDRSLHFIAVLRLAERKPK